MVFEAGLWIMMVAMAGAFTFFSFVTIGKARPAFSMLAIALWMGLSVISAAGIEVAATQTTVGADGCDATTGCVTTKTLIPGGEAGSWVSYIFIAFGIFQVMMLFKELVATAQGK